MIIELLAANIIYFQKPQIEMRPAAVELALTTPVEASFTIEGYIATVFGENEQIEAFNKIIQKESSGDYGAANSQSTAKGVCQMIKYNRDKYNVDLNDKESQIRGCTAYIRDRYGDPVAAWTFRQKHGWY